MAGTMGIHLACSSRHQTLGSRRGGRDAGRRRSPSVLTVDANQEDLCWHAAAGIRVRGETCAQQAL